MRFSVKRKLRSSLTNCSTRIKHLSRLLLRPILSGVLSRDSGTRSKVQWIRRTGRNFRYQRFLGCVQWWNSIESMDLISNIYPQPGNSLRQQLQHSGANTVSSSMGVRSALKPRGYRVNRRCRVRQTVFRDGEPSVYLKARSVGLRSVPGPCQPGVRSLSPGSIRTPATR